VRSCCRTGVLVGRGRSLEMDRAEVPVHSREVRQDGNELDSLLPYPHTAAPVLHYADSCGASATAYGPTRLLLYWHDNRQRLPIRRLLYLLEYSQCNSLTISCMHINVYNVCRILRGQNHRRRQFAIFAPFPGSLISDY
jgi:hypothetical protein